MDLGLKGKVAIVTGGGRGIGKGCSTVLAQEGCNLAIVDLAHDEGEPIYITKNGEGDLVVMSIEAFEQREEALKLRAKLEAAETARLSGAPTYSLAESRARLEGIYRHG